MKLPGILATLGLLIPALAFSQTPGSAKWPPVGWYSGIGPGSHSSPAIGDDGTIYYGSTQKKLQALADGGSTAIHKWLFSAPTANVTGVMVGDNGIIYASSLSGVIYAVNPSGIQQWNYATGGPIERSPALHADGTIFVGSNDNKLYAIRPNGTLKWVFAGATDDVFDPSVSLDTVYVGTGPGDGKLYAINVEDGSVKWSVSVGSVYGKPAIDQDGTLYVGSSNNALYAIDVFGVIKWTFAAPTGAIKNGPSIGGNGQIYFGSLDNNVYALNRSGVELWRHGMVGDVYSSPVVGSSENVFVASFKDGIVFPVTPNVKSLSHVNGAAVWGSSTQNNIAYSSPAIGATGGLYVAGWVSNSVDVMYFEALNAGVSAVANSSWPMYAQNRRRTARFDNIAFDVTVDNNVAGSIGYAGWVPIGVDIPVIVPFTKDGIWQSVSSSGYGAHGSDFVYAAASQATAFFKWHFSVPFSGNYRIKARIPSYVNGETTARYRMSGIDVQVDQLVNAGQLVTLGTVNLKKSGQYSLDLVRDAPTANLLADSLVIEWVGP